MSLQFAEKILQGVAIDCDTSKKAVDKMRLDIATSLLRESGVFPFCSTLSFISVLFKTVEIFWNNILQVPTLQRVK